MSTQSLQPNSNVNALKADKNDQYIRQINVQNANSLGLNSKNCLLREILVMSILLAHTTLKDFNYLLTYRFYRSTKLGADLEHPIASFVLVRCALVLVKVNNK